MSLAMKKTAKKKSAPRARRAMKLATILVPIDFSPASVHPIAWAKFLARRSGAKIHLVHAYEFSFPISASTPPLPASAAEIEERLRGHLQALAKKEGLRRATVHIREGEASKEICNLAEEIAADLTVISTHGRTGWERALLGSTAERIIRHSPCPVLVARKSTRGKAAVQLRRIVVPVDFSDCASEGLRYGLDLAQSFGAKLALLNVVQIHHDLPPSTIFTEGKLQRWGRQVAEAHMADLVRQINFGTVKFETAVKLGSPAEAISRYARRAGADLIVSSTHGRTGLPHVLMGSVAEHVVRYATLPVLIVPTRHRR
jgi:nucleotide-binding universal stress UspA family protein